jgi:hypothetical protein
MKLCEKQYDRETLKNNIYLFNLCDILKTQKVDVTFAVRYLLNPKYHLEENEKTNERKILNFFDLVSKRIVWITEPHINGERVKPNWEHDTNVITLWNVEHPESGQEWVRQAIHFPKNNSVK